MTIIAPSVLSLDFSQMAKQMEEVNQSKAQWLHFDVMDGHFVPNLTFGPDILKAFAKMTTKDLDVHLMVTDPIRYAPIFIEAGANWLTFHYEAMESENACIELAETIRSMHAHPGIVIKPNTSVDVLKQLWQHFELVLIMSVEPGFGGQKFDTSALEKIKTLRQWAQQANQPLHIEVDGGINEMTAQRCREMGADVLVAGSYVFKQDIKQAVDSLL